MPRDGHADDVAEALDPLTALPSWVKGEKRLSMMLPYVSLVNDRTIRTRGNELMQCIRLEGVNSTTSEDGCRVALYCETRSPTKSTAVLCP